MAKTNVETPDTVTIPGVHIFSAGTWTDSAGRKHTYSALDMQYMADANNELLNGNAWEAPVKIGHDQKQIVTDGLPSVGWLRNYRADGGKLYADFVNVPKKIASLIKARAWAKRSAEILADYTVEAVGKTFRYLVQAVSILGANLPALSNLEEIAGQYDGNNGGNVSIYDISTMEKYEYTKGDNPMTEEQIAALKQQMEDSNAKVAQYEKENSELKTKSADHEKAITERDQKLAEFAAAQKAQVDKERSEFMANLATKFPEKPVRDVLEQVLVSLDGHPAEFAKADGSKAPLAAEFRAILNAVPVRGIFYEKAGQREHKAAGEVKKFSKAEYGKMLDEKMKAMGEKDTSSYAAISRAHAAIVKEQGCSIATE